MYARLTVNQFASKNPITAIYFSNHQKQQLVALFIQQTASNISFKSLHSNRTKSISALTLKFSKLGKYVTTKRMFQTILQKRFL